MRLAVLGMGSAGTRHAQGLLQLGHEVVTYDPVSGDPPDSAVAAASEEEAIEAAEAVVVATPNAMHSAQARAAIERGRHVLVEKPLAATTRDGQAIAEISERSGLVCGVAMNWRFHTGIAVLRRLIESGELGAPRLATASFGYDLRLWRPSTDYRVSYSARADLGGGIVLDAIHELDYLLWLLGPASSVTAEAGHLSDLEIDVEDTAAAVITFASGALAAVDLNFFERAYRRRCTIVGSGASAEWDFGAAAVTVRRVGEPDATIGAACDLSQTYRAELVDFVEAVEQGRSPRTTFTEGLRALNLAEAIKRSALDGRRVGLDS